MQMDKHPQPCRTNSHGSTARLLLRNLNYITITRQPNFTLFPEYRNLHSLTATQTVGPRRAHLQVNPYISTPNRMHPPQKVTWHLCHMLKVVPAGVAILATTYINRGEGVPDTRPCPPLYPKIQHSPYPYPPTIQRCVVVVQLLIFLAARNTIPP